MPSLDNIATKVVELQEKLFEQNPKHVLVGYKYFSDKKNLMKIELSSLVAMAQVSLVH